VWEQLFPCEYLQKPALFAGEYIRFHSVLLSPNQCFAITETKSLVVWRGDGRNVYTAVIAYGFRVLRESSVEKPALRVILGICLAAILVYVVRSSHLQANLGKRDSIEYWAVGQLLIHHQNPYDPARIFDLERSQGYSEKQPLVLLTPPWSLFMVLPMGLTNAFSAWLIWISASLGCLVVAMRICWTMYADQTIPRTVFLLVGYTFAPVPACLVAAQMGLLLLLGVVLFLKLETSRPFLAGAALIFPFAKPHLLSFFWLALLVWVFARKKYAVAAGFLTAFLVANIISLKFDFTIFHNYRAMLSQTPVQSMFIPALSGVLRLIFFRRFFWVQFIPMTLGFVWCAWFLWVKRSTWNWRTHGPALMVVSVLTAPYAWMTDEVVLLPAILQAAVFVYSAKRKLSLKTRLAMTIFVCLNGLLLLILAAKIPFSTGIYFWSSLVWFGWYAYGRSRRRAALKRQPDAAILT